MLEHPRHPSEHGAVHLDEDAQVAARSRRRRKRRSTRWRRSYRATGGDIKSMIRVILNESWLAGGADEAQAAVPLSRLGVAGDESDRRRRCRRSTGQLNNLGQQLFAWDTPDGYPDKIEYWAGNIVPRWSFASTFANYNTATTIQRRHDARIAPGRRLPPST